ncbi:hypothetical protein SAMN05421678_11887 [Actinopolymorpha cephalotaxi]|uniref:Calcium-binding protein n=1 Tax=Actinopolymorpha cephalotaxi TaxID=504797 RepID=A0A1I3A767_9ACTN|nr:hypothetical protein [Actinopolymorpha cephalotaxi]NYH85298.1 hypothetical protein [Actinopolymorpha cephalotaxi]SFH45972.1 hypothetical protein SAMN05421678_11887 [Actinopolymorpha cephalotaxi]
MRSVRNAALLAAGAVVGCLLLAPPAGAEPYDTKITSTTINNAKPIVMGTSGSITRTVPVTVEVSEDSGGLGTVDAHLRSFGGLFFQYLEGPDSANMTCVPRTSTTVTCTGTAIVAQYSLDNGSAGRPVMLRMSGYTYDGVQYNLYSDPADSVLLLKETKLATANATPEPVRKNGTLTVTGRLTQPNWNSWDVDGNKVSVGYGGQSVRLQFRPAGATSYATVKTITSASDGTLRTTTPATTSGAWRWSFGGSSTTAGSVSAGDNVTLYKVAKLSVNASPEPVAKGGKLTVTGRLTRATTDAATTFVGYASQPVKLQFRKAGSSTYGTIKTSYTDANGYLKTTTTAGATGYWRWSYPGSSTVASVSAAGDYVALK